MMVFRKSEDIKSYERIIDFYYFGFMKTNKGICTLFFLQDAKQAIIFTPHFFKRYKERGVGELDWRARKKLTTAKRIEDIASVYFQRNLIFILMETERSYGNDYHIFSPTLDGVALINWNGTQHQLQANTFIAFSMLSERQMQRIRDYLAASSGEEGYSISKPIFADG